LFLGDEDFEIPAVLVEPRDGTPTWLFADDPRHAPLGLVPSARIGAAALLIDGDDYRIVRIAGDGSEEPGWRASGTLEVTPGGDATLEASLELGGIDGYDLAERVRELDANRRSLVGRNLASQLFSGWTIDEARLPERAAGERFHAQVRAVRRGAAQRVGDSTTLPLPLPPSDMFQRYGAPTPRALPLDVRGETTEQWSLLVTPADGLRLAGIPDDLRVSHELCDYVLTCRREGDGVRIHRTVRVRPGRIEPGTFASWVRILQTIDRAEQGRIVFTTR
jgi:hypothetical protein